ncbi:MAG TPA: hypothetical protein VFZ97_08755 [Acidimicrobiales bacterium]
MKHRSKVSTLPVVPGALGEADLFQERRTVVEEVLLDYLALSPARSGREENIEWLAGGLDDTAIWKFESSAKRSGEPRDKAGAIVLAKEEIVRICVTLLLGNARQNLSDSARWSGPPRVGVDCLSGQ